MKMVKFGNKTKKMYRVSKKCDEEDRFILEQKSKMKPDEFKRWLAIYQYERDFEFMDEVDYYVRECRDQRFRNEF